MAANIGHEIRNPITTVRGFLQILREDTDNADNIEYYDIMIEELDSANSIITQFLALAHDKIVVLKRQNLNSIIESILPLITANAIPSDKYIKLELQKVPDLLLDESEIYQLLLNMVNNSVDAMLPGGIVTIGTFMEGKSVVLSIKDEGKGIPQEVLDNIGTPFNTTKENGTG
jgi:signal transduction histidine kinase